MFEKGSITKEEFEEKHVGVLNTVAELIISHPDIPEDVDQSDLLGALTLLTTELRNELEDRVPEIVALKDEIAKKDKQIRKLQDTNQQLYLQKGTKSEQNPNAEPPTPPKKSFKEIGQMIEAL